MSSRHRSTAKFRLVYIFTLCIVAAIVLGTVGALASGRLGTHSLFAHAAAPAPVVGFTVTNTNDSGVGSLRAAMTGTRTPCRALTQSRSPQPVRSISIRRCPPSPTI